MLLACCEHLEELLRAGQPARAETYFAAHGELAADAESALDLIYVEFATRRELGEGPSPQEYFERFPQWRDLLERQFALENLLEGPALARDDDGDGGTGVETPPPAYADRFRVLGLLARGGIGQVMRAVDTELRREVAVKELQPTHAENEEVRARFLREAEITGKLEHPGIVPVYGLGRDAAGRPFYAMRLVHGQSLQEASAEFHRCPADQRRYFGLEFQKLLRRFLHVCQTVAYAHSRGVVHRDLKPENILLGPFGETLVVDWGLAKVMADDDLQLAKPSPAADGNDAAIQQDDCRENSLAHLSGALTQDAGQWIGTPAYMCPEQALGQAHRVGTAGDVYSLGATLYMLLTGRAPIVDSNVAQTLKRVIGGEFPRPREVNRSIPQPLEAICQKALALRPEDRYASPNDLADDLERWLADEPVTAARDNLVARLARWGRRNRTRVVAGGIALVLVTVVSLAAAILINGERLRTERQRVETDRQRVEANRRNARLAFDRGYSLSESHEHGAALLWYVRALAHTPNSDADMRRVILTNMDAVRGHLLRRRTVFAHEVTLSRARMSPSGNRLVTVDYDGLVRLWDAGSAELLGEHKFPSRVQAVTIDDQGTATCVGIQPKGLDLKVVHAESAEDASLLATLPLSGELSSAAFNSEGDLLAAGSRKLNASKVQVWQVSDGKMIGEFAHPGAVSEISFRPRHAHVATISGGGRLRLWEFASGRMVAEFPPHVGTVAEIAFTPDGEQVLVANSDGVLTCYEVDSQRRMGELFRCTTRVTGLACDAQGKLVAAACADGTAQIWDLPARRQLAELLRIDRHTSIVSFHPQAPQLLIASEPHSAVLWDIPETARIGAPQVQTQIHAVAMSRDGKSAVVGSRSAKAQLVETATGKRIGPEIKHGAAVQVVAFRPDGKVALTASHDGTARMWSAATGEQHGQQMDHPGLGNVRVDSAAFSADSRLLVTGDSSGIVRIWNGDTGAPLRAFGRQGGAVRSLCFNKRGDRLVAGFSNPTYFVRMFNVSNGEVVWTAVHKNTVRTVAVSPDDRWVLSASNDETARLWSADQGQPVGQILRHRGEVFIGAFSPDGSLAVTGGYDATVRLWAIPSCQSVGEPMRHNGIVTAADFSSDGKTLLTAGSVDRSARLWDVATCLPLAPPRVHSEDLVSAVLHPSGRIAFTDRLWQLPSPLPDEPTLLDQWTCLATQRVFRAGDNIEWLMPADLAARESEFQARTGRNWEQWAE